MKGLRSGGLDPAVDETRDHVRGGGDAAEFTLVEYGSYACQHCHTAHLVIANLQERFGDRLRHVYRHLPLADRTLATHAAEMVEYAAATGVPFWELHDRLMLRSHQFDDAALDKLAGEFGVPARENRDPELARMADDRVRENAKSGIRSGARATPTFFINGRRYEGAWDESALAEAMVGSVGQRLANASLDFARWAPSTGLLLLLMSLLAVVISNSPSGDAFTRMWQVPLGVALGRFSFELPVITWVNDGLLTVFFLVVGLEIKRELTVGRLADRRAAMLPLAGAFGGMLLPSLIYLLVVSPAEFSHGWGITIATDTAFAVALIVLLGPRVPVDLRVFLTAAVIADDLVAIGVVAVVYSDAIHIGYLAAAVATVLMLVAMNRAGVYRTLAYGIVGILLWFFLHEAGLHATLAGVILAMVTPTRPPANLAALMAQAQAVLRAHQARVGPDAGQVAPSTSTLQALDVIHDRIESPASSLLRTAEPWSSYFVLPIFALGNAGVQWSASVFEGHTPLMLAIVLGLLVGKPVGILGGSWLAVRIGIARRPESYTWAQLAGAGTLAGIGFTMSLFIAGQAFPRPEDFAAAKIAIFTASILAGIAGTFILYHTPSPKAPSPPAD